MGKRLFGALAPYIRWPDEEIVLEGLAALRQLLQHCWPRAAVHAEEILRILSECAADLYLNFDDDPDCLLEELLQEAVLLLKSSCVASGRASYFDVRLHPHLATVKCRTNTVY